MKKVVVAMDSFKGCLSSSEVEKAVTEIESRGESFVEEEIQEGQENLGGTGSRGFRRRKRNKPFNS